MENNYDNKNIVDNNVKSMKEIKELIVYGYINDKNNFFLNINIPTDIILTILLFYNYYDDEFDNEYCGYTTIDKNNQICTQTKYGHGTAYLKKLVYSGIHKWKFKILYAIDNYWFLIGICKINENYKYKKSGCYSFGVDKGYGFFLGTAQIMNRNSGRQKRDSNYGVRVKTNDIIEMILDMDKLQLSYTINDIEYGKACNVEKAKYKAVVDMFNLKHSLQLLPY